MCTYLHSYASRVEQVQSAVESHNLRTCHIVEQPCVFIYLSIDLFITDFAFQVVWRVTELVWGKRAARVAHTREKGATHMLRSHLLAREDSETPRALIPHHHRTNMWEAMVSTFCSMPTMLLERHFGCERFPTHFTEIIEILTGKHFAYGGWLIMLRVSRDRGRLIIGTPTFWKLGIGLKTNKKNSFN